MRAIITAYSDQRVIDIYTEKKHVGLWRSEELLITTYFHPKQLTLDLGAGTGRTTDPLRTMGYPTIALDMSEAMLKQNNAPSVQATGTHLPFKDKTFANILFSYNGICHLDTDMRYRCMQEVARVMKDQGIFIFTIEPKEWYHLRTTLQTVIHAGLEKEFPCPFYRLRKKEIWNILCTNSFTILYEGYKEDLVTEKNDYPNCYFFVTSRSSFS